MEPTRRTPAARLDTLRSAADTIVPTDDWPGGWDGGVARLLELEGDRPELDGAINQLEAAGFGGRDPAARAALLSELDSDALAALLRAVYEGYYGSYRGFVPPSWDMVGFRPLGSATAAVEPDPLRTVDLRGVRDAYDVVIVGAGAGGGVAAMVLAEAGARVLLVERARLHTNAELRGDHLHGKRAALYDPTAGPGAGHPRVVADRHGAARMVDSVTDPWAWGLNAMAVGGGTRVWQGMSWRFLPEDFGMATRY